MMRSLLLLTVIAGGVHACTLVEGDRILGSDLARADALYRALPPDLIAAFSPMVGSQRLLDAKHLTSLLRAQNVALPEVTPLCFERPTDLLSEPRLQAALARVLGGEARIEILDFSKYPIPKGELTFSLNELPRAPVGTGETAVTWRGHVKADARSTAMVWVKARISRLEGWVEAVEPIQVQQTVEAGQVALRSGWRYPFTTSPVRELESVVGQRALRSISPGQTVLPPMLARPNDVERGDLVSVEVASGAVSLRFAGTAESAGKRDDTVVIWVKDMGKRWHARVQDKGKVRIDVDQSKTQGLVARRNTAGSADAARSRRQAEEMAAAGAAISSGPLSR